MSKLIILYEHAAGYGLFSVKEFEEIGVLLPQVEASITDFARFNSVVATIGFQPFKTATSALENMSSTSEGVASKDLLNFLDSCLPKITKNQKVILGVADPKLGASITEVLNIKCDHTGVVPEIIRGIRFHFHKFVKGFTAKSSGIAQLGLGHSYSRSKVKFDVNREDHMVVQNVGLLDQLDKAINTFSMRIREWYGYHFPELVKIVPENYLYAKVVQLIKNRKELTDDKLEALEEIVMDSAKAQSIITASKSSMGMDINPIDLLNIEMFAARVISLSEYKKKAGVYLKSKMSDIAPNLTTLVGDQVGARLIAQAGSLTNLAKYPTSTIQILGAQKSLFRKLKTCEKTQKHGLLYHSKHIGRANTKDKGKISRYLASKCAIASRVDCFSDTPTNIYGKKLSQQVDERLKLYETGEVTKKSNHVVKEALEEASEAISKINDETLKKKKKNIKKKKANH